MTLQEIFRKVEFDDVASILLSIDERMAGSLTSAREAFDEVRLLTPAPKENDQIITLDYQEDNSHEASWVNWCDDDKWPVLAARTIDQSDLRETSDARIAALCLWEMTFDGFSEEDIEDEIHDGFLYYGFAEPRNKYEEEYRKLDKEWFPPRTLRIDEEIEERVQTEEEKALEDERWEYLRLLRRKAKIEDLCLMMERTGCTGFARQDLWDNLSNGFELNRFRSVVENPEDAVDYIIESLTQYDKADYSAFSKSFFIIHGNETTMRDAQRLVDVIKSHFPNPRIALGWSASEQIKINSAMIK